MGYSATHGLAKLYCRQVHRLNPLASTYRQLHGRRSFLTNVTRITTVSPVAAMHTFHDAPFEPAKLPTITKFQSSAAAPELLLIAACEEDFVKADDKVSLQTGSFEELNASLNGVISDIVEAGGFDGKQGQQSKILRVGAKDQPKYVGLLGLGKKDSLKPTSEWGPSPYQAAGAATSAMAIAHKAGSVAVDLPQTTCGQAVGAFARGLLASAWVPSRFKSKVPDPLKLEAVSLKVVVEDGEFEGQVKRAEAVARGSLLTRNLVESPPNVCTPTHMADAAAFVASKFPDTMKLQVLEKAACEALGMGSYLGVSECSEEPPKFIHLTYTPPGGANKKIAICGKGVTFDTGGYNLKAGPGSMIELMKFDMGGGAATIGAANIVGGLQPAGVEVHFIVAACENMVDGKGLRPGDVLTAANGKTIEVLNTDAEGRLTLADAVWYAQKEAGATTVVDVATLTGAAIVALGTEIAALFTANDKLSTSLTDASKAAGEKLWRMPLEAAYAEMLKSSVADMKNLGSRWGGAITGALFIKEFIEEGTEWAHIDLAGPVWNEKLGVPTGYGAMTLAEWVVAQGAAAKAE